VPAVANGPRVARRAAKPDGTTRNRTSSRASGGWAGIVHSSPAANREFSRNPLPPDGPRRAEAGARPLPAADAHALGNGTIAGGDAPCPARLPDTARPPTAVTKAAPLRRRLRYSTVREDEEEKTTSRTPSRDRAAHGNGPGLAAAAKSNHAGEGPRESQLPTVKSRQRSYPLRSGTPLSHYLLLIVPPSSLISPLQLFQPPTHLAPSAAILPCAAWPPGSAKLAPSFAATNSKRSFQQALQY